MIRLPHLATLIAFLVLSGCAVVQEDAVILAEPVVTEPSPQAKSPIEAECISGDGIGGTGCPAID